MVRERDLMWMGLRSDSSDSGMDTFRNLIENGLENGVLYNETAESVHSSVFSGWTRLREIYLPNVKRIDSEAFADCKEVYRIDLPNVEYIDNSAFCRVGNNGDTGVLTVNIPNINSIAVSAFLECTNLKEINVHNAEQIFQCAFDSCSNLEKVRLNNALVKLGFAAFCSPVLSAVILTDRENIIEDAGMFMNGFIHDDAQSAFMSGNCFVYVPSEMYTLYEYALTEAGVPEMLALFRKIEDYPEICE